MRKPWLPIGRASAYGDSNGNYGGSNYKLCIGSLIMITMVIDPSRPMCKVCGRRDKFDFHVPDEVWRGVVPAVFGNHVVCLSCFDDFARQRGYDYSGDIDLFVFSGDAASMSFRKEVA